MYRGLHPPDATCRIRIRKREGDVPVAIATALSDDSATRVINVAEDLTIEFIAKRFPKGFEEVIPVVWIEHHPSLEVRRRRGKTVESSLAEFESSGGEQNDRPGHRREGPASPGLEP